jgi:hypothetical protein
MDTQEARASVMIIRESMTVKRPDILTKLRTISWLSAPLDSPYNNSELGHQVEYLSPLDEAGSNQWNKRQLSSDELESIESRLLKSYPKHNSTALSFIPDSNAQYASIDTESRGNIRASAAT